MIYIKQSTDTNIIIGAFIDDTDGKTPETALDVTTMNCDIYKGIVKSDLTLTASGGVNDCVHVANGYYNLELTSSNVNTLGRFRVTVNITGALPVSHDYLIVTANVYDTLCSTDKYEVDITQMGGVTQSATDLKDFADVGYDPNTNSIEQCKVNDDMVGTNGANTTVPDVAGTAPTAVEIRTEMEGAGHDLDTIATDVAGLDGEAMRGTDSAALAADANPDLMYDGNIDAVVSQTQFSISGSSPQQNAYNNAVVIITDAIYPSNRCVRMCTGYTVGTTNDIFIDSPGNLTISSGDNLKIFPMRGTDSANVVIPDAAGVAPTAVEIRQEMEDTGTKLTLTLEDTDDLQGNQGAWATATSVTVSDKTGFSLSSIGIKAIWDQLTSGLTAAGSLGKLLVDNINATISSRNSVEPDPAGTAATLHGTTDAIVNAIKAKTDNLPSGIAKNEALPKFAFLMVLSANHVSPATGKTITGEIMKDGGAFAAITNTITEGSNGMYNIDDGFTQDEMNADIVTLKFTSIDCDPRIISIITS